jgi:hypothetical protein
LLISRDVLALGILVTEVLKESRDEEALQFMQFARDQMLLPDSSRRPDLTTGKRPNGSTNSSAFLNLKISMFSLLTQCCTPRKCFRFHTELRNRNFLP